MKDPKDLELKSTVPGADRYNYSQKWSKPVRPQRPTDATQGGPIDWQPGQMPIGGFRSVFKFSDTQSTKISNTGKPGRKVY
jgi:hypothetical protein